MLYTLTLFVAGPVLRDLSRPLHAFWQIYPEIQVHVKEVSPHCDLSCEDILIGPSLTHPSLTTVPLFNINRHFFASPSYIKKKGHPKKFQEAVAHKFLEYCPETACPEFLKGSRFQSSSYSLASLMCQKGEGIAFLPSCTQDSQGLVKVFEEEFIPEEKVTATYLSSSPHKPLFCDLLSCFQQD